uniref:Uncharacterized protein n=1 Tax=Strongyloides papillosus TaxID=174720 RepID=A0A0N5B402_STREA
MDYQNYDNKEGGKNEIDVFMNMLYSRLLNCKIQNLTNDKEIEDFFIDVLNKTPMKQKLLISTKLFQFAVEKYNDENQNLKDVYEALDFISLFTRFKHRSNKRSSNEKKLKSNDDCEVSVILSRNVEKKDQEENNNNKRNPAKINKSFKEVKCIAIIDPIETSSNGGELTLLKPVSEIKVELVKERNDLINILENGDFLLVGIQFNEFSDPHFKSGKLMAYDHKRLTNHTEVYALKSSSIVFKVNNRIDYVCESVIREGIKFYDRIKKSKKMTILIEKAGEKLNHKGSLIYLSENLKNILIQKKLFLFDLEVSIKIYEKIDHPILKQFDEIYFGPKKMIYFEENFEARKINY